MKAYVRVRYTGEPCFLAGHCNVVPGVELSLTWREWEVIQANESLDIFEKISEGDEPFPPRFPGESMSDEEVVAKLKKAIQELESENTMAVEMVEVSDEIERVEEIPVGMEDGEVSITDTETGEELDVEDFPVDPEDAPEVVEHYAGGELVGMEVTQPDGEVAAFGEVGEEEEAVEEGGYDTLEMDELRAVIKERTGKAPSPRAKRDTLISRLRELNEAEDARGE